MGLTPQALGKAEGAVLVGCRSDLNFRLQMAHSGAVLKDKYRSTETFYSALQMQHWKIRKLHPGKHYQDVRQKGKKYGRLLRWVATIAYMGLSSHPHHQIHHYHNVIIMTWVMLMTMNFRSA